MSFKVSTGAFALAAPFLSAAVCAQTYQFNDLNVLGGTYSSAVAINNLGQIVGQANFAAAGAASSALWSSATLGQAVAAPASFRAVDINDLGQIAGNVGGSLLPGGSTANPARAALLDASGLTVFPGLQAQPQGSTAVGLNNRGQVIGYAQTTTPYQYNPALFTTHATIFSVGHAPIDLGTLGGTNSFGRAVNNLGQATGLATASGDFNATPVVWPGAGATTALAGWNVYDINDRGQVAGSSFRDLTPPGWEPVLVQTATLFQADGTVVHLDTGLNLQGMSLARALNESGMVVGHAKQSEFAPTRGMLWTGGASIDLNTFLGADLQAAGWYISDANDINEAGSIVGNLANRLTGEQHGYLLTVAAVPEPGTYGLLLAGGALGAWRIRATRRSARQPAG